ncbi:GGDEF domain-containing protein [candidate division TA06 bacterium]|uniref:GGDEF domain-containing protein n=1 Tax=candidate division TA06 bacterium TaxID=2250710 RepID=A0A933IBL4_UNCT6|nr:GGDEF domain-containing protein [candidate division TA06 bacterium]
MENKIKSLAARISLLKSKKNLKKEELIDELNRAHSELRKLYKTLAERERQNREDSFTGLYNRRYLDIRLAHEFIRAQRYRRDLTVIMADLDYFKRINDSFSHQAGDQVLKTAARIFRDNCREIDLIARYGGDEFVLALPEMPCDGAIFFCERIRLAVEWYDWDHLMSGLKVTISQGIAAYNDKAESYQAMLRQADAKLYEAKQAGRNTVKY